MNILLIGGTGMVGSRILAEAQSRGHHVTAASRHGETRLNANDTEALCAALAGQDVLVVALGPSRTDKDAPKLVDTYRSILDALRGTGVRVLFVGGAGSLSAGSGVRLVDTPGFPEAYRAEALQAADGLALLRGVDDVNWTYFSPAVVIAPGERTGRYRLGLEEPVVNDAGEGHISAEDYAVALLDELETPRHERQRFTVGY